MFHSSPCWNGWRASLDLPHVKVFLVAHEESSGRKRCPGPRVLSLFFRGVSRHGKSALFAIAVRKRRFPSTRGVASFPDAWIRARNGIECTSFPLSGSRTRSTAREKQTSRSFPPSFAKTGDE